MTATFDAALSDDVSKVRFHIGDTDMSAAMLQDATLSALVSTHGTVEKAVIAALLHLISLVSRPNFRADWLQVDNRSAVQSLQDLLRLKREEFGISSITALMIPVKRTD